MARITAYSLSKEPDEIMRNHLAFMERAGVGELVMFFDGPISEGTQALLDARRDGPMRIHAEALDDAYWIERLGEVPAMKGKTNHLVQRALEIMSGDWLWVGDPDEFFERPDELHAALDAVPADVEAVILPPCEAVWGPGEDGAAPFTTRTFRLCFPPKHLGWLALRRLIYGRWHVYWQRGMLSHMAGKHFVRRGTRADGFTAHRPLRDGAPIGTPLHEAAGLARPIRVRHYDAVSLDRWFAKMRRNAERGFMANATQREARLKQVALVKDLFARMQAAPDEAAARAIGEAAFRRLYHVTPFQAALLRLIGGIATLEPALDPAAGPAEERSR